MPSFTERQTRPAGALDIALAEPPHNFEAEQALLGALLVRNYVAEAVRDRLQPEHFSDPLHGELYAAILRLIDKGLSADPLTIRPWFAQHGGAAGLTPEYVARLAAASVHALDAAQLAEIVRRQWQRRQLLAEAQRLHEIARNDDGEVNLEAQAQEVATTIDAIAYHAEQCAGFAPLKHGMAAAVTTLDNAYRQDVKLAGLSSGFERIDNIIGGFNAADLVILAGRPGMGKTALATNMAAHAASNGVGVGFFSLEMSAEQLALRLISEGAGISSSRLRRGDITQADYGRVVAASQALESWPLFIDERGAASLAQLRVAARRLQRQHGLGLVVVDYLQLIVGGERRRDANRVQEVSDITRGLKALAKELGVPIIALSQLSRANEKRESKRPVLSDLRESGSIEQDADLVLFVYRPDYYAAQDGDTRSPHARIADIGKAEIIISKNRHGPTGATELHFDGRLTRFNEH